MNFYKQDSQALFEKLIWAKPERVVDREVVLIIGGHAHYLQAPLVAFGHLKKYQLRSSVILPDALKKMFKPQKSDDFNIFFYASTPAGSLAQKDFDEILKLALKHDCLLIAGDLSSNQETEQLILKLLREFKGHKLVVGKIVKVILASKDQLSENLNLILQPSQLPALNQYCPTKEAYKPTMSTELFTQFLESLNLKYNLITSYNQSLWVKVDQKICATNANIFQNDKNSFLQLAALSSFYLINNPRQPWEALVSAAWQARTNEV